MTLWKYILDGSFYASGPTKLSVESGDRESAREEIAEICGVDPSEVSDFWETDVEAEARLIGLLASKNQMSLFRDN